MSDFETSREVVGWVPYDLQDPVTVRVATTHGGIDALHRQQFGHVPANPWLNHSYAHTHTTTPPIQSAGFQAEIPIATVMETFGPSFQMAHEPPIQHRMIDAFGEPFDIHDTVRVTPTSLGMELLQASEARRHEMMRNYGDGDHIQPLVDEHGRVEMEFWRAAQVFGGHAMGIPGGTIEPVIELYDRRVAAPETSNVDWIASQVFPQ